MAPTTYLAPGVYVEEVPSAQQPIAGVGTNIVGFVGVVPDDDPVRRVPNREYDPTLALAAPGPTDNQRAISAAQEDVRKAEARRTAGADAPLDTANKALAADARRRRTPRRHGSNQQKTQARARPEGRRHRHHGGQHEALGGAHGASAGPSGWREALPPRIVQGPHRPVRHRDVHELHSVHGPIGSVLGGSSAQSSPRSSRIDARSGWFLQERRHALLRGPPRNRERGQLG